MCVLTKKKLETTFRNAIKGDHDYIGVKIRTQGYPEDEIIINKNEKFKVKLDYYIHAYDDNLILKTFSGIRIVAIASGKIENVIDKLERF